MPTSDSGGSGRALCSTCHLPLSHPVVRCDCMDHVLAEVVWFFPSCPICRSSARVVPCQPNPGTDFGSFYRCSSGPSHPTGSLGEARPVEFNTRGQWRTG